MIVPEPEFMEEHLALEAVYLGSEVPEKQSGYSGGRERWVNERSPIATALNRSGTFLDVGCANGLLLWDIIHWAGARDIEIEPHGLDLGAGLIELARERHPDHRDNFSVGDAWIWQPDRRFTYCYSLLDAAPDHLMSEWIARLGDWVELGGRLILGSYGSTSRGEDPVDPGPLLRAAGFAVAGSAGGGEPVNALYAWSEIG